MHVKCIIDLQFYKKLKVNIPMKKLTRHLEIEKIKTEPGNSLRKPKISAKSKNPAKNHDFLFDFLFKPK